MYYASFESTTGSNLKPQCQSSNSSPFEHLGGFKTLLDAPRSGLPQTPHDLNLPTPSLGINQLPGVELKLKSATTAIICDVGSSEFAIFRAPPPLLTGAYDHVQSCSRNVDTFIQ